MAFPDSVQSFTTKNSGDLIQAAHVNDVQTEIVAIESGYINGTAPIVSSRATIGSGLSVAGGSTLAGTLSVAGGSTFAVRPVTPPPPFVRMIPDSTYAVASSALSTLTWMTVSISNNSSLHSTVTGEESQKFTPDSTGIWELTCQVETDTPSSGVRAVSIRDSSGTIFGYQRVTNSTRLTFNLSAYKNFNTTGGWFTVVFENPGASTHSVEVTNTWCSLTKL